jgi:ribosome recycling factor
MKLKGELKKMAIKTMTQDTKDQIANLERQKIALEDQLEFIGNNLVKMVEIENEIFEIEDTIKKLIG